jgi:hypothetical protein
LTIFGSSGSYNPDLTDSAVGQGQDLPDVTDREKKYNCKH